MPWANSALPRPVSVPATGPLLQVQVGVGTLKDGGDRVAGGGCRDADRPGERVRLLELGQDVPGAGLVGGGQAEDELVAAVAAQQARPAQATRPSGRQVAEQQVAGPVALPVVDLLEVVQVE